MSRHTLGSFKQTANWGAILNMEPSDPRWLLWLNEALETLMNIGLYCGTVQQYQVCVCSACLTWPRQFETIEVIDVCNRPFVLRNHWFEFLENGPGRARIKDCSSYNVFDRGRGFVMFDDLRVASRVRLYPQFAADVGAIVNLRGYDANGQWVLTQGGATVGENVALALPYVDSLTTWMPQVFREAIKARTNGYVRAYGWNAALPVPPASPSATDTPLQPLAIWEPSETLPNYRRSFIPYLSPKTGGASGSCGCASGSTTAPCCNSVTVMAKIAFTPLTNDLDFIPLTCAPALKMGMLSVMRQERGDTEGARAAMFGTWDPTRKRFVNGAVPLLDDELGAFQGDGTVAPIRTESFAIGGSYVQNLI